ncbi:MoxR family ATPase [Streptomyces sp. NPDC051987]|uniref:AAA family ATPase n=1 Tax=Streptomyces sp. NPDC051987 TaxID=3155808 RepID=UPI0034155640
MTSDTASPGAAAGAAAPVPPARPLPPEEFAARFRRLCEAVCLVVRGKPETVELTLICLLAEGHLLIEDVPGVGKTTIARSLAAAVGTPWSRIQFTPDLLPSDVTGVSVYDQRSATFVFRPGPVFAGVVLADEINRASPKTQSALLEVMEERHVTVDGVAHPVPAPFVVVATQNPVDMDGTYPLPEAQLDRFLMRISVGYPDTDAEVAVLNGRREARRVSDIQPATNAAQVQQMIRAAESLYVADALCRYIVRVVAATRDVPQVRLGASPRGSLALLRSVQVRAASQGRSFATPDDVKALAVPVLAHRILLTTEGHVKGLTPTAVVEGALASVEVPHDVEGRS